MKISQLYVYPIKSLRPTALSESELTSHGFPHDRHFMLLKVEEDGRLVNMHVPNFPRMALFLTDIVFPDDAQGQDGKIIVTYRQPMSHNDKDCIKTLDIPLKPRIDNLKTFEVVMHQSPTHAYDMGEQYNSWFSDCFGFDVILAYIGDNRRTVLGNMSPNAEQEKTQSGWLSRVAENVTSLGGWVGKDTNDPESITFADVAPYLVVSESSLDNVSARLPEKMDITKFRPNIVISGAPKEFEEDYWRELKVKDDITLVLTNNCARCISINIDFDTGAPGTGEMGAVLKKLMKDRRIDQGTKYSPIFGRYGFLGRGCEGSHIKIGDEVEVSKTNSEHTKLGELIIKASLLLQPANKSARVAWVDKLIISL
ncbi:MOSC domain-containing protein [Coccidioides immitis RS]|uniref:MOSC domain-containing protein n=1 Tax=Coccidioides immitis (strain RS) TaxID=246410 RepID=J3KI21_COCIM|nr:MOSC domain-containing protein [Coccidioides immitis RS]EAS35569.3 MOSC domain-containing protein [Coccidioides immitis RS]